MKPRNRKAGTGKKETWNTGMETGSAKHGSRKFDSMKPEVVRKHIGLGSQKTRDSKARRGAQKQDIYATPEVKN
jgi:hypothetical protein